MSRGTALVVANAADAGPERLALNARRVQGLGERIGSSGAR
jgi:hypothetical protein